MKPLLLASAMLVLVVPLALLLGAALPAETCQEEVAGSAVAQDAPGTRISAAAMLAGTWRQERPDGSLVEEIWSAPGGDNVVGAFRWLAPGGKATMFEVLTITARADGTFLRLRHFGPGLEAWEAPDAPQTLRLEESAPGELRFAAHAHCEELAGVTYDRSEEDVLAIEVRFTEESGRPPLRFRLTRA